MFSYRVKSKSWWRNLSDIQLKRDYWKDSGGIRVGKLVLPENKVVLANHFDLSAQTQ